MQCREIEELLSPYLDGVLHPSEGEEITAHLAVCPDCQAEWHALCEVADLFKTLPEVAPPSGFSARVINNIASQQPLSWKKTGVAAVFRNLTRGHWSRIVALAATVVFAVGVTALMYGLPGHWGTKNLFLPQAAYNPGESQDSPDKGSNESPEPSGIGKIFKSTSPVSDSADRTRTNATDTRTPDSAGPVTGNRDASPPAAIQPEASGVKPDASSGRNTSQVEQLKSLLEEQARGDSSLPPAARMLAAPQTLAVKEGAISQQTAFGYIPVSNKESRKVIRSASIGLTADDPAGAPAKIAEIARNSGGYLLPGDSGGGTITLKAPADRLNQVVSNIQGMGHAILRQVDGEDVSEKYYSYEVKLRELADEEQRLLAVTGSAGSATDIQSAQSRLMNVREDLERQKKLLSGLSNEVEMATIKIDLN